MRVFSSGSAEVSRISTVRTVFLPSSSDSTCFATVRVTRAAGGLCRCGDPQVEATLPPSARPDLYVRWKIVLPSTIQAAVVQRKMKTIAATRLPMCPP